MCSSRSSLSISGFPQVPGTELLGLRQHALERSKVRGGVLGQGLFDLLRECFGIVDCSLDLGIWPLKMFRDGSDIFFITANKEQYLPHCKRASLDVSLSVYGRIPKINEGIFRAS